MLTYPSDPLPQIVCPMDEDAIPPNSFCSAPPHREPPPPLLPLSSTTPSCANDGASGHRRSGRIQSIRAQTPQKQSSTDGRAAPRPPRQNPSPSKRQKESMVQVSQSKQPKVDGTPEHENQNEEVLAFSCAAENQNKKKRKTPLKKPGVSAAEDIAEQTADNTKQNPDTAKSDMDACGGLSVGHNVENTSAPKGWVIGPLFQSLKSKMASFTEIVMSPVKLFRANSPPPSMDHPDELGECELRADDIELSEPIDLFNPVAQIENGTQETKANQQRLSKVEGEQKPVALKYSKRLSFDSDLSTRSSGGADECAITAKEMNSPDSVPLHHSPSPCVASDEASEYVGSFIKSSILPQPSVNVSASHECDLKMPKREEVHKGKLSVRGRPLPRRCMGTRSEADRRKKVTSEVTMEETSEVVNEQDSCPVLVKSSDDHKTLSVSPSVCYTQPDGEDVDDGRETGSCQTLGNILNSGANGRTLKPPLDSQQLNPETFPAAGLGKVKRGLHQDSDVQETVKRKRIKAATNTKKQELLTPASDKAVLRGLNPASKEVGSTNIADMEETLKPARKRQPAKTRVNKKGKGGQDVLTTINESLPSTRAEISSDAMSVCSLERSSSVSECKQKKPSASHKRLKAKTDRSKDDVNMDSCMDLETTVAITSTKETELQTLPEVLVRPNIKELQRRNINKKPVKRKTPSQPNQSNPESGSSAVSIPSALSMEPSELTSTDFNTSELVEKQKSRKQAINQPSKRAKKGCRGAVKPSVSGGTQEMKQCIQNNLKTKENQSQEGDGKMSTDPVYFEMTPFESNHQPVSSACESRLDCSEQLNKDNTQSLIGKENNSVSQEEECFPTEAEAGNRSSVFRRRSSAKGVNMRPRRDNQRRKCRVLHRRARKGDQETNSVTMDDADLVAAGCSSENDPSKRLLRSYSCPEIPSVHPLEAPWTSSLHSPHHSRTHTHHHHQPAHTFSSHIHKSVRRARRHTVCSVEVEREIAPLCLRKEVYPSRRSFPYDAATQHLSPTLALSPSTSLSALASSFLSSPLAFLSKKADSRGATSPSTSTHVSSPSSSSSIFSLSPSTWRLPGFLPRADPSSAASDCGSSGIPLECEIKRRQQSDEEDDCEDTSSSSQEFEDVGLREEKALSDSEIKVVQKLEERGKVSSIRIRKALPKPQNNLTPMGLPKPVRLKKKEFSLEEIYTNKNFSKPPESRLETIFEVPLNRRNGSESWFGQRRLKRFLEFLEVGEARKPKKSLVGVAKAGNSSSRTRRGCFPKDEPPLGLQDVDSLLCAKLDQLNLWLIHDQNDS